MVVDGYETQRELIINRIDEAGLRRHMTPLLILIEMIKNDFQIDSFTSDDIEFISSGGSSAVIAIHHHDQLGDRVFQYYEDPKVFERIKQIFKAVDASRHQTFDVCAIAGHSLNSPRLHINYDLTQFLVRPQNWYPELQTIVWDKIQPINHLPSTWLMSQIDHLIWDIGKAIAGLHLIGYSHADVRIDNIGWNGRQFVLYDFNLTKPHQVSQYSNDYLTFGRSLRDALNLPLDTLVPFAKVDYQFFLLALKAKGFQTYEQVVAFLERR